MKAVFQFLWQWIKGANRLLTAIGFALIFFGLTLTLKAGYLKWHLKTDIFFSELFLLLFACALFWLGGSVGIFTLYVLFSFFLLELILSFMTGACSDTLLQALATSGGFHHFKGGVFLWLSIGVLLAFFLRRFVPRNLTFARRYFLLFTAGILIHLAIGYQKVIPFKLQTSPTIAFGIKNANKKPISFAHPQVLTRIAYDTRRILPGPLGDFLAMLGFAIDPGVDTLASKHHQRPENIHPAPEHEVKNIVLVIGESATSTHYSTYGYPVLTAPFLDKMLGQKKACYLPKAHSAANETKNAVLPSISLWSPTDTNTVLSDLNLIELANQQHYQTYWASVQSERGSYSGFIGYVAKYADYFLDSESKSLLFNGEALSLKNETDESLLPFLEKFSTDKAQGEDTKKLIILHLWGSHRPYREKVRKEDSQALPRASLYDRSIHRTDRILSQITEIAEKNLDHPLILYISDHGENPFRAGHAILRGAKDYEIPVVLLGDRSQENCDYLESLRSEDGWYSSNMNKFLMMRLLGMEGDQNWIKNEKDPDLVYHTDNEIYRWGEIPGQHLN
ncbi:hypothetical protein FAI40_03380 [Acetobacteraceae bacterium]|nr:hypothetical protein FAI40_03380 [Acetobacteraceae bacterium]